MKRKHVVVVAMGVLVVAGGLWLVRSTGRDEAVKDSGMRGEVEAGEGVGQRVDVQPGGREGQPEHTLRPPDPSRRFTDFTPEQRVEFARKGHGPGG